MYYEIVNGMCENNIKIWNDFYPCEVLLITGGVILNRNLIFTNVGWT